MICLPVRSPLITGRLAIFGLQVEEDVKKNPQAPLVLRDLRILCE